MSSAGIRSESGRILTKTIVSLNTIYIESPIRKGSGLTDLDKLIALAKECERLGAYLAGGCVRDYLLLPGTKAKDYDIFISNTLGNGTYVNTSLFGQGYRVSDDFISNKTRDEVLAVDKYDHVNVDVILMDKSTVEGMIATFDSSICQVWLEVVDGHTVVMCSPDFLHYLVTGDWILYTDIETSQSHVDRLIAKFGVHSIEMESSTFSGIKLGRLSDIRSILKGLENKK